jgi:aminoglycoside phosphotransferase (APT) family kinase protein
VNHKEPPIPSASVDPSRPETARAGYVLSIVAERLGRSLSGWHSTATEPTDAGYLYGYDLELSAADGGVEHRLVFVEDADHPGDDRELLRIPANGLDAAVSVWLYPNDPDLPALRSLIDPSSTRAALARMGIETEATATEVVSYRPNRRAVVRVDTPTGRLYLKVVEPAKAAALAERHEQFRASALPVPRLLGWSSDGVVALSELPGIEAQFAVQRMRDPGAFLDQVEFLTSLLADVPAISTARASLLDRLDWYVDRLADRLPEERERIESLGTVIARSGADGRSYHSTPVTVHGDLHLGQLFVDPDDVCSVTGMLDIDTAGAGDPADDAAAFYAHLVALGELAAASDPDYANACWALAARWLARWPRNRNAGFAARARAIAATHLLGHALRPLAADAAQASIRLLERAEDLVAGA